MRPPVRPLTPATDGAQLVIVNDHGDEVVLVVGDRQVRLAAAGRAQGKLSGLRLEGRDAWQIELTVADGSRFVRRFMVCEKLPSGALVKTFDRLIESAAGALLLYATVTVRDVDGDRHDELVVEERATGGRKQTLVYRRASDGQFRTADPSLWKVVP